MCEREIKGSFYILVTVSLEVWQADFFWEWNLAGRWNRLEDHRNNKRALEEISLGAMQPGSISGGKEGIQ